MKDMNTVIGTVTFKDLDTDEKLLEFDTTENNLLDCTDKLISKNKLLSMVIEFINLGVTREDLIKYHNENNIPLSEEEIQATLLIESKILHRLYLLYDNMLERL